MTHVVTENCNGCRFTDCVATCPVTCFHTDGEMVYIDTESCVDCGACVTACPVDAIYQMFMLPDELTNWIDINREKVAAHPVIKGKHDPLPGAEQRQEALGL